LQHLHFRRSLSALPDQQAVRNLNWSQRR
jgi:hypothetical protein